MNTVYDLGIAIENIRSAAGSIEVSGQKNVECLYMIFTLCNDIIKALNELVEKNSTEKPIIQDGEEDGQVNS